MPLWLAILVLILSLTALCKGADFLLEASEKIGVILGLSPLAVGFFLIAFGTSLPEMFVSHSACLRGYPGIALGNIFGSNISNIFLILGVAACWRPLPLGGGEVRDQILLHGLLSVLLVGLLAWGEVGLPASLLLLAFFTYSMYRTYRNMQSEDAGEREESGFEWMLLVKFLVGLAFLSLGGEWVVTSSSAIARAWGVGEYVVSAVLVAVGTSLPELVTVIRACRRKSDTGLIVGNVIGSNIFNVAFVMASLGFYSVPLSWKFLPEVALMIAISTIFFWCCRSGQSLRRTAGVALLVAHGGITLYWFLSGGA